MAILYKFELVNDNDIPDVYQPTYYLAFTICLLLFILYGILGLFDMYKNIHSMIIPEIPNISRSSFIYAYVFGYVVFILRIIVNLITLYVFVIIIMLAFYTVWWIIKDESTEWINNAADIIWSITVYIFGIFLTIHFYVIFLFFIPIVLAFILQLYSKFIDIPLLKLENENDMKKIMLTHHKIMIFLLVTFFYLGIIAYIFNWQLLS
jgi:hypothetical protein